MANAISRDEVLSKRELASGFAQIADAISARVMSCVELPRVVREDILRDWPIVLAETVDRQTRLPRGKRMNGDLPVEIEPASK
jgi:hypothetical protein